jgi:hypothetical protein
MPVSTQFIHAGETVRLHWGWWHIGRFQEAYNLETNHHDYVHCPTCLVSTDHCAVCLESEGHESHQRLSSLTQYKFHGTHTFTDESDGEVLTIVPGDVFKWWRE